MIGPFVTSDGTDIYTSDRLLQWLLWILISVMCVCSLIYVGIIINNATFEHTYTKHPGSPGTLSSERYTFYWWVYWASTIVIVLAPPLAMFMILFRTTYASNLLVMLLLLLLALAHVFVLVSLVSAYATCNRNGYPLNPCNSNLYCCIMEVYTDPVNDCPNVTPCPPGPEGPSTIGELKANEDFLWVFWINVFYFVCFIVLTGVFLFYWTLPSSYMAPPQSLEEEKDPETLNAVESHMMHKKHVGLRKRLK
jgi:hypothetical protein